MKWFKDNLIWIFPPILLSYLYYANYVSSQDKSLKGAFEGSFFLMLAVPITLIYVAMIITAVFRKIKR